MTTVCEFACAALMNTHGTAVVEEKHSDCTRWFAASALAGITATNEKSEPLEALCVVEPLSTLTWVVAAPWGEVREKEPPPVLPPAVAAVVGELPVAALPPLLLF